MIVSACDPGHPDALALVEELSEALAAITGDSGKASFCADDARGPGALFVVARAPGGALLGCAALRPLGGAGGVQARRVGEVKRMYARPGTRGAGAALLAHIESAAVQCGYHELWLETRRVNTRALGFYLRHGYAAIASYGKYIGRADAICLGKQLAPPA